MNQYWWIETGVPSEEQASGCVRYAVSQYSYSKVKQAVWRIYRLNLDRKDLNASDKVVLYCLCERYRVQSMSSTDAVGYLSKMCGMNRTTVGKSIQRLVDAGLIWIVEEGEARKAHKRLEARKYFKKHFLIVGLSYMLAEGGS